MLKRITCLVLSIVMLISCFSVCFGVFAADDIMERLVSLAKQFPDKKYWNHMGSDVNGADGWTNEPCDSHRNCSFFPGECSCNSFDNSIQCMGYAYKIAYEITGVSARNFTKSKTLKASALRVGDVIRYNGHSICVTGVNGNRISFTDCNYTGLCQIRWGQMELSSVKNFSYVLHCEGNNRKNTDLDFYESIDTVDSETQTVAREVWQMGNNTLNVRKSASTSAEAVGTIPAEGKFYVYEKKNTDDYLWGKVKYGSVSGWAALNYSEYISGKYEKADIANAKESYDSLDITFKWEKVSGAEKYQLRIYDENKRLIQKYYTAKNTYSFTLPENGKYYAKVYSHNSHCSSWLVDGKLIEFTAEEVKHEDAAISEIKLKEKISVVKGKEASLTAQVLPENAKDKSVTWQSDNKAVAAVTSEGVVKALSYGYANITCTSADGKITATCKVTVKPKKVTGAKQLTSKTTAKTLPLTWNEVEDAEGYDVLRYNSSKKKYESLGSTEETGFKDKTVKAGKDYYYVIRAYVTVDGKKIISSNAKVKCSSDPKAVTGVKQSASSSGTVTLKWNKVTNADLYVIYKYNSKTKSYEKVKTASKTTVKLTQTAGSSSTYRIKAATKTEWGYVYGKESENFKATAGPNKVTAKLTNAGTGKVRISWDKVKNATHYQIYRYGSDGYEKIATVKSKYGSFTNINLKSGKTYRYRVRAVIVKDDLTAYGSYSAKLKIKAK